jgi:hypothetical protein
VFLESGLEYEWVGMGVSKGAVPRMLELFDMRRRQINRAGEQSVWLFYRKEDYMRMRKQQN